MPTIDVDVIVSLVADFSERLGLKPTPRLRWFRNVEFAEATEAMARGAFVFTSTIEGIGFMRRADVWVDVRHLTGEIEGTDQLIDTLSHEVYHAANPSQPEQMARAYGQVIAAQYRPASEAEI